MASVKFMIRGKTNPSPLYVRFSHTREINFFITVPILVNPKTWDAKYEKIRNVNDVKNRDEINLKLYELKLHIINEFNKAYMQGEIINRDIFDSFIKIFFNQNTQQSKFRIKEEEVYLTAFADWWLSEIAPKYKVKANKYIDSKTLKHYEILNNLFKQFEGKKRIKLNEVSGEVFDDFSKYLSSCNYAKATITRMITRCKFFCSRAEELNLNVNKNYKQRVFVKEELVEYKEPYLSIDEINKIFNLKIDNQELDSIRDNFIIGLWTGLRISDLHRLSLENINNGMIEIKTFKTGHSVAIPLHSQVIQILNKRGGILPAKCSDVHFNREIKKICRLAKINNIILGAKLLPEIDPVTNEQKIDSVSKKKVYRKQVDKYKKYELVSSHICRRSFATNHFGKVPNNIIMAIAGWKSEKQMFEYNKQTNIESAKVLAEFWNKEIEKLEKV